MKAFAPFRLDTVNQCLWRRWNSGADERLRFFAHLPFRHRPFARYSTARLGSANNLTTTQQTAVRAAPVF